MAWGSSKVIARPAECHRLLMINIFLMRAGNSQALHKKCSQTTNIACVAVWFHAHCSHSARQINHLGSARGTRCYVQDASTLRQFTWCVKRRSEHYSNNQRGTVWKDWQGEQDFADLPVTKLVYQSWWQHQTDHNYGAFMWFNEVLRWFITWSSGTCAQTLKFRPGNICKHSQRSVQFLKADDMLITFTCQ